MKKIITIILICILSISCYAAGIEKGKFVIEGKISGIPDGANITLNLSGTHAPDKLVEKVPIREGYFKFAVALGEHNCYSVGVEGNYGRCLFLADNTVITLQGSVTSEMRDENLIYNFDGVTVKGSALNDLFVQKNLRPALNLKHKAIRTKYDGLVTKMNKAKEVGDTVAFAKMKAGDEYKAYLAADAEFFKEVASSFTNMILANKDSWWGPFLMLQFNTYFTKESEPVFNAMSKEAQESYYGKLVKKELFPDRFIGKQAPAFAVTYSGPFAGSKAGSTITLADLIVGKKYIIIDFWASWCNPCRKEIPNLKAIYTKFADKGLEIISISIDKKETDWVKAMQQEQLPWPSFVDSSGMIFNKYLGKVVPTMFILNSTGKVLYDDLRGEGLAKKLDAIF
ncbi:MAG: TlpA disulfide reductase family protein [Bacteroidales bacterium]